MGCFSGWFVSPFRARTCAQLGDVDAAGGVDGVVAELCFSNAKGDRVVEAPEPARPTPENPPVDVSTAPQAEGKLEADPAAQPAAPDEELEVVVDTVPEAVAPPAQEGETQPAKVEEEREKEKTHSLDVCEEVAPLARPSTSLAWGPWWRDGHATPVTATPSVGESFEASALNSARRFGSECSVSTHSWYSAQQTLVQVSQASEPVAPRRLAAAAAAAPPRHPTAHAHGRDPRMLLARARAEPAKGHGSLIGRIEADLQQLLDCDSEEQAARARRGAPGARVNARVARANVARGRIQLYAGSASRGRTLRDSGAVV